MNYSEKLLDPRWQKKRLEILGRDMFECRICHSTDKTVHVHHRHYIKGREPWDYPNDLLVTLCHVCHKKEEDAAGSAEEILNTLHHWGYFNFEITDVLNRMINKKIQEKKNHAEPIVKRLDELRQG
jgi:5-methylcytosine-specific restriction endonuclease McrA